MTRKSETLGKGDRALKLFEQGIETSAIKERLGFNSIQAVNAQIHQARERRERMAKLGEVAE
jgi:hypothetical protein